MKKTEIPLGRSDCISKKRNERSMTQLQIKVVFSSLVPPHTHIHRSIDSSADVLLLLITQLIHMDELIEYR